MKRKHYICLIVSLIFVMNFEIGHASDFQIELFSKQLSQRFVNDIAQDSTGMVWFATRNGLSRFDGYEFTYHKNYPGEKCRLTTNRIDRLAVSATNKLWCTTHDMNGYVFDPATEQFYDPLNQSADLGQSPNIQWIYTFPNGITWIARKGEAYRIDEHRWQPEGTEGMTRYGYDEAGFNCSRIEKIVIDSRNREWIMTNKEVHLVGDTLQIDGLQAVAMCEDGDRVYLLDRNNKIACFRGNNKRPQLIEIPIEEGWSREINYIAPDTLAIGHHRGLLFYYPSQHRFEQIGITARVDKIYRDSHQAVWVFTAESGVYRYDLTTKQLKLFTHNPVTKYKGDKNSLSYWREDQYGTVWVVPRHGRIGYYDPVREDIYPLLLNPADPASVYAPVTRFYAEDRQGNLWCALESGVMKISSSPASLQHTILASNVETKAMMRDRHNRIWIGSRNGEIHLFTPTWERIGYLAPDGRITKQRVRFGAHAYCLYEDPKDQSIYIGSRFHGLFRLREADAQRYRIEHYMHDENDPASLSEDAVYSILRDSHRRLWIGSYEGGLNLVQEANGKLQFLHAGNGLNYPMEPYANIRVLREMNGRMYIGTTEGMVTFDLAFEDPASIRFVATDTNGPLEESLIAPDVRDIFYTASGEGYVLSFTGGLSRILSEEPLRFEHYTHKEGLPSEDLLAMSEDQHGQLWIVAENELFSFDPATKQFRTYGNRYHGEHFYYGESKPLMLGHELWLGTTGGFCRVKTDRLEQSTYIPPIALSEIRINGEPIKGANYLDELLLRPNERNLAVEFAALDYNSTQIDYAYRLVGLEDTWHQIGTNRSVTYMDLKPNTYTLEIRSTNGDGRAVDNLRRLTIRVIPTFWETGWATLLWCVLGVLFLALAIGIPLYIFRLKTRIDFQQQLTDIKLRFFTDISHELRTPLTLISSPLDLLAEDRKLSDRSRRHLEIVRTNTFRMLQLVNQILDFRKLNNRKMRLLLREEDALTVIRSVKENFRQMAKKQHIAYSLKCSQRTLTGWIDSDKLEKILFNLISNAFKYTPSGKRITIEAAKEKEHLVVRVVDEGIGIEAKQQATIFERYNTLSTNRLFRQSTGIGLALVKELVDLHGGEIGVESTPGKGSTFTLRLPLSHEAFTVLPHAEFILSDSSNEEPRERVVVRNNESEQGEQRPRILIVEDNDELRTVLRDILSDDYTVYEAVDGVEGLQMAEEVQPDLLLSDIIMPRMDGLEMIRALKQQAATSHLSIILLSAKSSLDERIEGLEEGVDDYIPKPFHAGYLVARIRTLLARRHELQQRYLRLVLEQSGETLSEQELPVAGSEDRFTQQAIRLIERHLDEADWSVEQFASEMNISYSLLNQKLKHIVGITAVEFVREIRFKEARRLMLAGNHEIATVAYMVGFSDPKYFGRVFKKRFGMTPSAFIAECKERRSSDEATA